MIPVIGRIDLPGSNNLEEIHRVIRNLDQRFRLLEKRVPTVTGAAVLLPSGSGTSTSRSTSSSSSSETTESALPANPIVSFLTIRQLAIDPEDGDVKTDEDGYGLVELVQIPVKADVLTALSMNVPVSGDVYHWVPEYDFDETAKYVNIEGDITTALRIDTTLSGKIILFRNGTTGEEAGTVSVALLDSDPQDAGIIIPREGLALLQSNTEGTALELVEYYG
jgi:hypothetical protein